MYMTESEIITDYRQAKYKDKQISILAQLNCCPVAKIREILEKNGVLETETRKKPGPKRKKETVQQENCVNTTMKKIENNNHIPDAVRNTLENRAKIIIAKIMELEKEYDEIQDFLMGVKKNGANS